MLLAIDTSTQYAGIALLDDEGQLDQLLQWRSQRNHTVELLPAIETLLQRGHTTVQDITGIAIAVGVMVDASVVLVENLHKHRERHPERSQLDNVLNASREVGPALFFSLAIVTVISTLPSTL